MDNPSRPLAPNAGRVITPKVAWTVRDDGGDFYFKSPWGLFVAPDGSVLCLDNGQILRFGQDGRFLGDLFRKGQGPGELLYAGGAAFPKGNMVVYAMNPKKMIWYDSEGRYIKDETLPPKNLFPRLIGWVDGRWLFQNAEIPLHKGESAYVERMHTLLAWTGNAADYERLTSFAVMIYAVASRSGYRGMFTYAPFLCVPFGDQHLAVVHTPEYLVKVHDIRAGRTTRQFRRAYRRVPPPPLKPGEERPSVNLGGEVVWEPVRELDNDITNLFVRGDRFWVVTSTRETSKGPLIDVFDASGVYRDAFYLGLPEAGQSALRFSGTSAVRGDGLWTIEQTPEGMYQLNKYLLK